MLRHHISSHVQLAFRLRDEDLRVAAILCEVILQDDWKGPAAWLRSVFTGNPQRPSIGQAPSGSSGHRAPDQFDRINLALKNVWAHRAWSASDKSIKLLRISSASSKASTVKYCTLHSIRACLLAKLQNIVIHCHTYTGVFMIIIESLHHHVSCDRPGPGLETEPHLSEKVPEPSLGWP